MYELIQAGPSSYYINCPAKIGIYVTDAEHVYLIDSGNDKDAGRRVMKILNQHGWKLNGIINTHSNADHIGGNHYLQHQTGCPIFANGIEAAFTEHPLLETSFLYGGYPPKDLRHKFLMAAESRVLPVSDPSFPAELQIIPLPGHFFDMIGIRTPDGTVFLADCISSRSVLEKYQVAFIYDVKKYLDTLAMVEQMEAAVFVPAHAEASCDIRDLVAFNRKKLLEVADHILEFCRTPIDFEDILQKVFDRYHLTMNFEQYVLVGSTIRSYLAWLRDTGRADVQFENNKLLWSSSWSSSCPSSI